MPAEHSFLALRGLKSLVLRMGQSSSAVKIARRLEAHAKVRRVFYPGLQSHPQHAPARSQMRAFGGMILIEPEGVLQALPRALQFCSRWPR